MKVKHIKFKDEQIEKIRRFANKRTNGNFSLAVRYLVENGIERIEFLDGACKK